MVRRWLTLSFSVLALASITGCSSCVGVPGPDEDSGTPVVTDDAGTDGGELADGGDGGEPEAPADGGEPEAPTDAGEPEAPTDAGEPEAPTDAGEPEAPADGGTDDAGTPPPPDCTEDANCNLGELCEGGECVVGCRDDRDCPTEPFQLYCDTNLDDHGRCVTCTEASHCGDTETCFEGECVPSCSAQAPDCGPDLVCDTMNDVCVNCLQDADCDLGFLCTDQQCLPGCANDRDCPDGRVCGLDNQCIEGCEVSPDTCPLGAHCNATTRVCDLGCNGNNDRCGEGQECIDDTCENVCADSDDCIRGETCSGGQCVPGCQENNECRGGVCTEDNTGSVGECVECLQNDDCGAFTNHCNLDTNTCTNECTPGQFGQCWAGSENICREDGVCVECLEDGDCNAFSSCNGDNLCEPNGNLCDPCQSNEECGGGICARNPTGADGNQRICTESCDADEDCPQAFACQIHQIDGVAQGKICVPTSTVGNASCDAYRSYNEQVGCHAAALCGPLNGGNWMCVGAFNPIFGTGTCGLWCATDTDCPDGNVCAPGLDEIGIPEPGMGSTGTCQPD